MDLVVIDISTTMAKTKLNLLPSYCLSHLSGWLGKREYLSDQLERVITLLYKKDGRKKKMIFIRLSALFSLA
jgi:hypothetical protein